MRPEMMDTIPLWCFLPILLLVCILTFEGGYRLGNWRHTHALKEDEAPVAAIVAAILGLLAFMVAFAFNLAASRFDARRDAALQEVHAIGTSYLRSQLVPEPVSGEIAGLLIRYTELRTRKFTPENIGDILAESELLQQEIWSKAVVAGKKDPSSSMTGMLLESLNETFKLQTQRVAAGIYSRIPPLIWFSLMGLVMLGMISVGYQSGLAATRRSPLMLLLLVAFSGVLYLIVDLDRAHEGLLQINQSAIVNLYEKMQSNHP